MAMGKRQKERQESLFIAADGLAKSAGHPFYQKLNALLAEAELRSLDRSAAAGRTTSRKRSAASRPFRRACTFACCWSATSRASTASAASPGGVPTA